MARPIDDSKQQEAEQRDDQSPKEEAMVAFVRVFEVRIETDDRGVGAELCQSDKECGGINKDACESDFLACEEAGKNEESSQKAHRNPDIGYDGAFDTLSCDDTHRKGNKVLKDFNDLKDLKDLFLDAEEFDLENKRGVRWDRT